MFEILQTTKSILIIEPDDQTRETLDSFFRKDYICEKTDSAKDALELIEEDKFSVILMDYGLQNFNGLDFLSVIYSHSPNSAVIFLSEKESLRDAIEAFRAGAFDFIPKPFELQQIEHAVLKAFEHYEVKNLSNTYQNKLERLVKQRTEQLNKALEDVENSYRVTLKALVQALETRDSETHGHSERVVTFSLRLAHEVGLEEERMRDLELGALLHDIGKIGVPDMILRKPAKLSEREWEKMKLHPLQGYQILRDIPFLEGAARVVSQHHERWDGKGYPCGLRGEQIDMCARIFAVADAFDAMTSNRVYRQGRTFEEAYRELEKHAGTQFDPEIVKAFKEVPTEDWDFLRTRSIRNRQETFSFQAVVNELVHKTQYLEMVH
jgi:response regulator RpfG family c-di-GMP phosphodiesterase